MRLTDREARIRAGEAGEAPRLALEQQIAVGDFFDAERLAWGDTGTVIWANSVTGARTNYEAGPAAVAAGLTGVTPAYGYHLDAQRVGTLRFEVRCALNDYADWGALGGIVGRRALDYFRVPVLAGVRNAP